jgi:hypothetical protein
MDLPIIGQEVRPQGRKGIFRVVRIDLRQGVADLQYTTGTRYLEKNIPFEAIRSVNVNDEAVQGAPSRKVPSVY